MVASEARGSLLCSLFHTPARNKPTHRWQKGCPSPREQEVQRGTREQSKHQLDARTSADLIPLKVSLPLCYKQLTPVIPSLLQRAPL